MSWGAPRSYPRAIVHIDGDSFFASCEVARNPSLRGRPVVTGKERGIVSSMTYEAKRLGITRAMPLHEIARKFPEAVILPSDYETYSLYSMRMYEIVRRYTPAVEEYSIDECFADLTGMRRVHRASYEDIVRRMKRALESELGMTFGAGLSATKTLAKIGSKWNKPAGFTSVPLNDAARFLAEVPVGQVWGIGPNTAAFLQKFGIRSAQEFAGRDEAWVRAHCTKPIRETWMELCGEVVLELDVEGRRGYQSISKTKTFTPPSCAAEFVFAELSKNIENACIKARRWKLAATEVQVHLKTQAFRYRSCAISLPFPTNVPHDILPVVRAQFSHLFRPGEQYRATGVTLLKLQKAAVVQLDLFGSVAKGRAIARVYERVDALSARYGKHAVYLASSHPALNRTIREGQRGGPSTITPPRFRGETRRRRLGLAYLGEVE